MAQLNSKYHLAIPMGYNAITQNQAHHDPRQRTSTSWGIKFLAALGAQITVELVHELNVDGQQLRVVKLTDGQRIAQGQGLSAEVNPLRRVSAFCLRHSASRLYPLAPPPARHERE